VDTDEAVCRALAEELRRAYGPQRVWLADRHRTAGQAKSVIARCSWFAGARMHSTIAALSSGVPTGGVAYSGKMAPVFAGVGQEETTVDARVGDSDAIVGRLLELWRDREAARVSLAERLPAVLAGWTEQMRAIMEAADEAADEEVDA
jgi:polysaccharide pyruvyl transferase WcaK-like protein